MPKRKLKQPVRFWRWNDGAVVYNLNLISQHNINRGDGEFKYEPIKVRCPDGKLRTCKIRDNTYGQETFLGDIYYTIEQPKKKRVRIPGYVRPEKTEYVFIPNQDAQYAWAILTTLKENAS